MKNIIVLFVLVSSLAFGQENDSATDEIKKFQEDLNTQYKDKDESPLKAKNLVKFKEHPFFPIDLKYRVKAKFIKTKNPVPFAMQTSSGHSQRYQEYGKAVFKIDKKQYQLSVYQSLDLIKKEEYKDHLFLPFRDATNGSETYGGGKYLDLKIPEGKTIIIDFNQSYQPYCAYTPMTYSCPIVPETNILPIEIKAGVKYEDIWY